MSNKGFNQSHNYTAELTIDMNCKNEYDKKLSSLILSIFDDETLEEICCATCLKLRLKDISRLSLDIFNKSKINDLV